MNFSKLSINILIFRWPISNKKGLLNCSSVGTSWQDLYQSYHWIASLLTCRNFSILWKRKYYSALDISHLARYLLIWGTLPSYECNPYYNLGYFFRTALLFWYISLTYLMRISHSSFKSFDLWTCWTITCHRYDQFYNPRFCFWFRSKGVQSCRSNTLGECVSVSLMPNGKSLGFY